MCDSWRLATVVCTAATIAFTINIRCQMEKVKRAENELSACQEEVVAWKLKHGQCEIAIARASEDYAKAFSAAQAQYTEIIKANEERRNEVDKAIDKAVESDDVCRNWSDTVIPEQLRNALRQAR